MRPIEAEFLAGPPNHTSIQNFMRTPEGHLGLSTVTMDGHHRHTVVTLLMFVPIEPAPLLGQPFAKCCTFHRTSPVKHQNHALPLTRTTKTPASKML